MLFKFCGAIMILAAAGLAGYSMAQNYLERPKQIRFIISGLRMLATEVRYGATPLPLALNVTGTKMLGPGAIFSRTGEMLSNGDGLTASEAWSKSIDEYAPQAFLQNEDMEILRSLGGTLGLSDREDQEKHLVLAMEHLKLQLVKAEEDAAKNGRLWQSLGIMGGLVFVIMLV